MSLNCVGAWHIRPTPARFEGGGDVKKTWNGPISTEMYGRGLKDLCNKTQDNINRLSFQIKKMDPCLDYGVKHWHPSSRPKSAQPRIEKVQSNGKWESPDVMFAHNKTFDSLSSTTDADTDTYVEPAAPANKFCYLCSTLEEHQRHILHHTPKRRPVSAKPRISFIAPKPKQKRKEEEDENIQVRERLYKLEVFTSNLTNAGTNAKVYIAMQGSLEILPRIELTKKRGCSKLCMVRASKEVFHVKGPFLGNLQILSIEHDGKEKGQGWHLDRVEVTDVKAMKTWVFRCGQWLSMFEKPLYSNRVDLTAEDKDTPQTEYNIEVFTGKQKMAGTDSNIFLTLHGQHGSSKKVHLKDQSSGKKLFERNSIDKFRIVMPNCGELKRIRIEHDGKGFAAGWYLDKVVIEDSERPRDRYYFTYGGWIAKDEGDGKLWREIRAKKSLPKELKHVKRRFKPGGTDTKFHISVKTGDVKYAGTDADVFIQMAGAHGITPKLNLDDAKNNFERNMVDNFEMRAVNVGPLKHIVIGHDNSGPGAGWFLEKVTVRRYVPKDEALDRLKKMKKRLKNENLTKKKNLDKTEYEDDTDSETDDYFKHKGCGERKKRENSEKDQKYKKDKKDKKEKKHSKSAGGNFFSVSSDSSSSSSDSSDEDSNTSKRHGSPLSRRRPSSALSRDGSSSGRRESEDSRGDRDSRHRRASSSASSFDRGQSERRASTSASSQRRKEENERDKKRGKGKSVYDDDDDLDELKVPLYEEYVIMCNRWLATDEDDGLYVREFPVTNKTTYFKE